MKVSIITTALNAEATIRSCLDSVAAQRRESPQGRAVEVEQIVVDAASGDATCAIAREYPETVRRIVSEPDRGIFDGMNKGIALASGDVTGILNADDFYSQPDALGRVVDAIAGGTDACYGNVAYVDPDNPFRCRRLWRERPFRRTRFRYGWMPPHPSVFVRAGAYRRYGAFRLDMGTAADYELMLRLFYKRRLRVTYVPQLWIAMRQGGASNASVRGRLRANRMDRRAWRVNHVTPVPGLRLMKPLRKVPQFLAGGKDELVAHLALVPESALTDARERLRRSA
ncbi:MAG TPA: glycosyltransferase family 2 protein [Gammaproteobacteria bacterium]|nr:glycosyltransferase family 2 protein [Gammaproteobacteria bacterium]